jgi:hypothetical protein
VSDPRAICADCGHVRSWHDADTARATPSGELSSERRCYREIGGAGCPCSGFRDSGEVAVLAVPSRAGGNVLMLPLLIVLLIVMGLALLYAYRSQSPSVQTVAYTQAIQQLNSAQVRKVTITGSRAALELASGEKQHTILPQPPAVFETALADYNAANPTRAVVVEYQPESAGFQVITSILLSLLPLLLLGGIFIYLRSRSRSR